MINGIKDETSSNQKGPNKMEYIREVINSQKLEDIFFIPESLKNKMVEILIVPIAKTKHEIRDLKGVLKQYANSLLIEKEKDAWSVAVEEKHGNR